MSLKVVKPGLLSTVQDLGRVGYQQEGVLVSGAMDAEALRLANLLVGNPVWAPALEITLLGPSLRFTSDHIISMTGASYQPRVNGEPVPAGRSLLIREGALLEVGGASAGCRGYLAVAGGIQVPLVMGSASTYLRAGIGGFQGRALQEGDLLPCRSLEPEEQILIDWKGDDLPKQACVPATWYPAPGLLPRYEKDPMVRVVAGPEYGWFTPASQQALWEEPFRVSSRSDRMGYRLEGPCLMMPEKRELLSTAVTFGTVQVPAEGNPIVLMADHQTTGGYPRIAQVITADFATLAQVSPGQYLRFQEVTLEEAHRLYFQREQCLEELKSAISFKFKK